MSAIDTSSTALRSAAVFIGGMAPEWASRARNNARLRSVAALLSALAAEKEAVEAERDAASRQVTRLLRAVRYAEEVLSLSEMPAREDPTYAEAVRTLGERIGYGALMTSASATWRAKLGETGGEFSVGPCHSTVLHALAELRAALAEPGAHTHG